MAAHIPGEIVLDLRDGNPASLSIDRVRVRIVQQSGGAAGEVDLIYPKRIGSTRKAPVLHCCSVAELIHFVGADLPIHANYVAIAAVHKFTRCWVSGEL